MGRKASINLPNYTCKKSQRDNELCLKHFLIVFCGCFLALTSTGPGGPMAFVCMYVGGVCPGASEDSFGGDSGFIASQKTGPQL